MGFLYERKRKTNKIIITYKYYSLFYIIFFVLLVAFIAVQSRLAQTIIFCLLFALLVIKTINMWKPNIEIRKAMKKGKLKVSGQKFSFKDPLRFEISK